MLHTPAGPVMSPEWYDLDRKIKEGDGLLWPGDPDLWLGIGVITEGGRVVAHRLEVHRDCEDGATRLIGTWHPGEQFRVVYDLANMRAEAPGHVSVLETIDAANDVKEAELSSQFRDSMGEAMEHASKLFHDTTEGRNVFRGMPGRRDAS